MTAASAAMLTNNLIGLDKDGTVVAALANDQGWLQVSAGPVCTVAFAARGSASSPSHCGH